MEILGPLDASFLYLEDGITHMHIGSCAVFGGPVPAYRDVAGAISAKLGQVPRYRQVVRFVPMQLGRPVWVDDPHFTLDYHVRNTALPPPGGPAELRQLMGWVMSQELDRHRPLWETWMVDGLQDGRWALISKLHHCLADGVSGTDLLSVVLDRDPHPAPAAAGEWAPEPAPSDLRLATDAVARLVFSPYEQMRAVRRMLRTPGRTLRQLRDLTSGWESYAQRLTPTARSSFTGSIGPHRRWTWAAADLADLKTVRRTFGGTLNDVILAVITGGLRRLLLHRGEDVDRLVIRTLGPVSIRRETERGTPGNRVSAIYAELPVAIGDPLERLSSVRRQMDSLKQSHQVLAGESITALGDLAPFIVVVAAERAAMRVLRRMPENSVQTVTTDVPGPDYPLYLLGREMHEYLPFVPIAQGVRIGVAIITYHGRVAFGITGDYDSAPDIDVLAHGIDDAIAELVSLATPTASARAARPAAPAARATSRRRRQPAAPPAAPE